MSHRCTALTLATLLAACGGEAATPPSSTTSSASGGAGGTSTSTGTTATGGGGAAPAPIPTSCQDGAPGADSSCGPDGKSDCCASVVVPGGTFNRSNDPTWPATVSPFRLDVYEVTLGRFRKYLAANPATMTTPPAPGAGAHEKIPGSGWDAAWNDFQNDWLEYDKDALVTKLHCGDTGSSMAYLGDLSDKYESYPMNCLTWFDAFAFCAWDGGRLPTEAEWNFAAAGGEEQRLYPWGDTPPAPEVEESWVGVPSMIAAAGAHPEDVGRWGHFDFAANFTEWVLDAPGTYPYPCDDCANLAPFEEPPMRGIRGNHYHSLTAEYMKTTWRDVIHAETWRTGWLAVRCARPASP